MKYFVYKNQRKQVCKDTETEICQIMVLISVTILELIDIKKRTNESHRRRISTG